MPGSFGQGLVSLRFFLPAGVRMTDATYSKDAVPGER